MTYNRNLGEFIDEGIEYMDQHTAYYIKGDVIWASGSKAKHEIMRGQWGRELKDVNLPEFLTLFKKTFRRVRNVFHSRAQFFNMKQDDNETLDEYWKRLVDIERKFDFNNITAEEIIIQIRGHYQRQTSPRQIYKRPTENTIGTGNHRT